MKYLAPANAQKTMANITVSVDIVDWGRCPFSSVVLGNVPCSSVADNDVSRTRKFLRS